MSRKLDHIRIQLIVPSVLKEQIVVVSPLNDPALFENEDSVGISDG